MIYARQSTAIAVTVGPVLDADGAAVTDGVVGDFKISKNGGAPAALNGSATLTHRNTGHYSLALTTSDVATVGTVEIVIDDTVNGCAPKEIQVVEEAVYDAVFAASANAFTGAAGSSKISGVVLADTVTTYTGNTPQTGDAYAIVNSGTHGNSALKTLIDTVDNFIDTEIGTIVTGVAAIEVDTQDIQSRIPAALTGDGNIKADALRVNGSATAASNFVIVFATDFATNYDTTLDMWNVDVEFIDGVAPTVPTTGTADSGTTATMVDAARTEADDDYWNGSYILFTSGTLAGQCRLITDFVAATDTITFAPATTQAVSTHTYEIIPAARVDLHSMAGTAYTSGAIPAAVAGAAGGIFIAGTNAATTITTALTTTFTGSLTGNVNGNVGGNITGSVGSVVGAVGSVTGAVGSVTGNVGGNVVGTVASVVGAVGSVTGLTASNLDTTISSRASPADVNAQVLDVLDVDTFAQPGQEAPAATTTIRKMLAYLYKGWRNRKTQTSTEQKLYADDGTTVDQKSTHSDDGTTYVSGEIGTGP